MRVRLTEYERRMTAVADGIGRFVGPDQAASLLRRVLHSGDRVVLEGNNQKQARFLVRVLAGLDVADVSDLHMLSSSLVLDEHTDLFEKGIAHRLDFAFSGPQAVRLAQLVRERKVRIGAIHTYLELYARYFTDLRPNVALLAGETADRDGNVYLGTNTEETPLLCEATHAAKGIVIVQVKEVVDRLPRIDLPADRIEFIVECGERPYIEPLFTRDPARITHAQIVMAAMVIKGIYAPYEVRTINHGIGYAAAAVSEKKGIPVFVDELDGVALWREGLLEAPAVMLNARDITHIVTERGIAFLLRCRGADERRAAIRAIAGDTPVGRRAKSEETADLRARGIVHDPADLDIDPDAMGAEWLAARSLQDLADQSGGLYRPPESLLTKT